jgi:acetyl-CoA carboxylase carboxyl transferase subunit beta
MTKWFQREKDNLSGSKKRDMPEGVWNKCPSCDAVLYSRKIERNWFVCDNCGHHMRMSAPKYVQLLSDQGTWSEINKEMKSLDPLGFKDSKKYVDRISAGIKKTNRNDAVITGLCEINGHPTVLGVMDFQFLGGSVGSVVGEKISRAIDQALELEASFVLISCSGGMRMQEGIISLMQMAKTSARLSRLGQAGLPFISILTDPTTGGTTASFSMLGDVNIAEPKALIGFAGPRVIKQTIGQDLPEGFQRSEFLMETGFLDQVVPRLELKDRVAEFISWMTGRESVVEKTAEASE